MDKTDQTMHISIICCSGGHNGSGGDGSGDNSGDSANSGGDGSGDSDGVSVTL